MDNGIEVEKFNSTIKNILRAKLEKIVNHMNTHKGITAEINDLGIKMIANEGLEFSKEQKENLLDLFVNGGIVKQESKDNGTELEFFLIKPMKDE